MEINCGSVKLITLQQNPLMCAGGEAGLAALLLLILVKAQLLNLTKECMKQLTDQPKIRGDNCASFHNNAMDANDDDDDDEDEEGEEGEDDENEDDDRNRNDNKSDPIKGHNGAPTGGAQENGQGEDDSDEQGDANDDEDEDDDDGEEGSEEGVGEEEDEEEEEEEEEDEDEDEDEEEIQPPKKRKK